VEFLQNLPGGKRNAKGAPGFSGVAFSLMVLAAA
jgi:hypothetical protein